MQPSTTVQALLAAIEGLEAGERIYEKSGWMDDGRWEAIQNGLKLCREELGRLRG